MRPGGTLRIARLAGIDIRISPTWLVILALVVWSFSTSAFPATLPDRSGTTYLAMSLVAAALFFGSIVVHEMGHSLVARRFGIGVESITLFLFGGVATLTDEAKRPRHEALIALAGPIASVLVAGALLGGDLLLIAVGGPVEARAVLELLTWLNVLLAAFNLLPGMPLDGGRVLRAAVWARTKSLERASRIAGVCGRVLGGLMAGVGVAEVALGRTTGLWLVVLGYFVFVSAAGSERQTTLRASLDRLTAGELMTPNPLGVDPDTTIAAAVDDLFARHPFRAYPVRDLLTPLGMLTLERVRQVDRGRWGLTRVHEVMAPLDGSVVAPETPVLGLLPRLRAGGRLLVVDADGDLRGILSPSDVQAWLARRQGRPAHPRTVG